MAVSQEFCQYVLDQLGRVAPVRLRRMFGGAGIYAGDLFFALVADDVLYFKVDDSNRPDFERRGLGPFKPFRNKPGVMSYYEVPAEVLEAPELLREWVRKAIAAARLAGGSRPGRTGGGRKPAGAAASRLPRRRRR